MPSLTLKEIWALSDSRGSVLLREMITVGIQMAEVGPRGRFREHEQVGRFDRPALSTHVASTLNTSPHFRLPADGFYTLEQDLPDEHPPSPSGSDSGASD